MDNEDFNKRLADALKQAGMNKNEKNKEDSGSSFAALARGMRIGFEFLGGIVTGLAIGYGIDYYAGTTPLFLTIFLFLGFGAGLLNIYRLLNNIETTIGVNRKEFLDVTKGDDGGQ